MSECKHEVGKSLYCSSNVMLVFREFGLREDSKKWSRQVLQPDIEFTFPRRSNVVVAVFNVDDLHHCAISDTLFW